MKISTPSDVQLWLEKDVLPKLGDSFHPDFPFESYQSAGRKVFTKRQAAALNLEIDRCRQVLRMRDMDPKSFMIYHAKTLGYYPIAPGTVTCQDCGTSVKELDIYVKNDNVVCPRCAR